MIFAFRFIQVHPSKSETKIPPHTLEGALAEGAPSDPLLAVAVAKGRGWGTLGQNLLVSLPVGAAQCVWSLVWIQSGRNWYYLGSQMLWDEGEATGTHWRAVLGCSALQLPTTG